MAGRTGQGIGRILCAGEGRGDPGTVTGLIPRTEGVHIVSALLWWLIPLGATLLALAWAAWRSRPERAVDVHTSISNQARFNAAMGRPVPRESAQPTARTRGRRVNDGFAQRRYRGNATPPSRGNQPA